MLPKALLYLLTLALVLLAVSCTSASKPEPVKTLDAIPIELATNSGIKEVYLDTEEIQFLLSLGDDAYIYMFHIDADNSLTQLLPNDAQQNNFYKAGYFLTIPEYKDHYRFKVSAPYGEEVMWVIASDTDIDISAVNQSIDELRLLIRQASNRAYNEVQFPIATRKALNIK